MRRELLIATNNAHKLRELRTMIDPLYFHVRIPSDLGLSVEVDETGGTFEENAILKAEAFTMASGMVCVADDSGIEVDALGGAPGVLSARYGGEGATDQDRNNLLLSRLKDTPSCRRTARFVAVIAVAGPDIRTRTFRGEVEGVIADACRGTNGFGYDPLFYYPPYGRTFGEVPSAAKDVVSHRARAVAAARAYIDSMGRGAILE